MIEIISLKETIESGGTSYPIYIALLSASTISRIAEVPSYEDTTKNNEIARNVSHRPVKEWQRPKIPEKIEAIRQLFDNTGEFMPNPVLLGENVYAAHRPRIKQHMAGGHATPAWQIEIDEVADGNEKALWILDGQHRIDGLSASAQSANPVPVVLLLNQGGNFYQPDTLAKIFAQVTTSATALGPLHKEWLSYAFCLNEYSTIKADSAAQHRSMEVVVELCKTPTYHGHSNPFFDRIHFNDNGAPMKMEPGGHTYTCKDLKEIVYDYYYNASKIQPELEPAQLAELMCEARRELESLVTIPQKSVFFGDETHHHKIMEDAYWAGVLTHVSYHKIPIVWRDLLRTLQFNTTSWDFSWKKTLHGRDQSLSKTLAIRVMKEIFQHGRLPVGTKNLADFLRGNGAQIVVEAFKLTPAGKVSNVGTLDLPVRKGDTTSFPLDDHVGLRVKKDYSLNIVEISVTDKKAPPGTLVEYKEILGKSGLKLDKSKHKTPLELLFTFKHYGGVSSTADVDVVWHPE